MCGDGIDVCSPNKKTWSLIVVWISNNTLYHNGLLHKYSGLISTTFDFILIMNKLDIGIDAVRKVH